MMDDRDSMIDNINVYYTLASQIVYIDIKIEEEDKCITLSCSFLDSLDNMIVENGSASQTTLKIKDIVTYLLSKERGKKPWIVKVRMPYL